MKSPLTHPGFLFVSCLFASLALFSACSPKHVDELKNQTKDSGLEISIVGANAYDAVTLTAKNTSASVKSLYVPAGIVLTSENKDASPMLVVAAYQLSVAPQEEKSQTIRAFGVDFKKLSPSEADAFGTANYTRHDSKDIKNLVTYLTSEKGKKTYDVESEDARKVIQRAIWRVTDKIDYDKNLQYQTDTYMFSTLLQQNPATISLFLDNAENIKTAEEFQSAVFGLLMDRDLLHDKLKTLFADNYDPIVSSLGQQLEENQEAALRDRVNALLSKAHVNMKY
jgi:hypothetical protein